MLATVARWRGPADPSVSLNPALARSLNPASTPCSTLPLRPPAPRKAAPGPVLCRNRWRSAVFPTVCAQNGSSEEGWRPGGEDEGPPRTLICAETVGARRSYHQFVHKSGVTTSLCTKRVWRGGRAGLGGEEGQPGGGGGGERKVLHEAPVASPLSSPGRARRLAAELTPSHTPSLRDASHHIAPLKASFCNAVMTRANIDSRRTSDTSAADL